MTIALSCAVTPTYLTSYLPYSPYLTLKSRFLLPQVAPKREEPKTSLALETTCHKREQLSPPSVTKSPTISSLLRFSSIIRIADCQKFDGHVDTVPLQSHSQNIATHDQANRIFLKSPRFALSNDIPYV